MVTMLAVALAACTALMSFGLLALSDVDGGARVRSDHAVGILLAFLLAPLGRLAARPEAMPIDRRGMTT